MSHLRTGGAAEGAISLGFGVLAGVGGSSTLGYTQEASHKMLQADETTSSTTIQVDLGDPDYGGKC